MSNRVITCIVCPRSCRIEVLETEDGYEFSGYGCKRGLKHAETEIECPIRMLTSTVVIEGASLRRLPVISTSEIPKSKLKECLSEVYKIKVQSPIKIGDIIIKDICGTGIDIVSARSMKRVDF